MGDMSWHLPFCCVAELKQYSDSPVLSTSPFTQKDSIGHQQWYGKLLHLRTLRYERGKILQLTFFSQVPYLQLIGDCFMYYPLRC